MIKALERLGAIWSQLAGAVSVVYVFGFIAYKARLNLLGIRTELALLNERYLSEGAAFLAESLRTLMFPYALFVALFATAFAAAAHRFRWWQRFRQRARESARSRGALMAVLWIAALVLLLTVKVEIIDAIAQFQPRSDSPCPAAPAALNYQVQVWVAVLVLIAPFAVRQLAAGPVTVALHVFLALLATMVALALPMVYGSRVAAGRTELEWVRVLFKTADDGQTTTGALLLETDKAVVVCNKDGRFSYPHDGVRSIETLCLIAATADKLECPSAGGTHDKTVQR